MPDADAILSESSDLPPVALIPKTKGVVNRKLRCRVGGIVQNVVTGRRQREILSQAQPMPLHSNLERMPPPLIADAGVQAFCLRAVMQANEVGRPCEVRIQQASNAGAPVCQNLADGRVVEQM